MKAKDLMIGDLINGFGVVRRVTSICGLERPEDDGLLTTMVPGCEFPESNLSFRPCYAQPIPLTAEILEKNGFKWDELPKFAVNEITEKTKRTFSYHLGSRTVFVGVNEPNFNLTSACVLYVHELQHILRQSRIEKEIIL